MFPVAAFFYSNSVKPRNKCASRETKTSGQGDPLPATADVQPDEKSNHNDRGYSSGESRFPGKKGQSQSAGNPLIFHRAQQYETGNSFTVHVQQITCSFNQKTEYKGTGKTS